MQDVSFILQRLQFNALPSFFIQNLVAGWCLLRDALVRWILSNKLFYMHLLTKKPNVIYLHGFQRLKKGRFVLKRKFIQVLAYIECGIINVLAKLDDIGENN